MFLCLPRGIAIIVFLPLLSSLAVVVLINFLKAVSFVYEFVSLCFFSEVKQEG